ncbi:MAG TPA: sugar transferase [Elusimicrobiota bacterium]|jgi:exopolysaccharide biosynthesis polyprenyl glycosylphosphotransferase|nr:sugar transferase [Elusimicrobiota bacterium]
MRREERSTTSDVYQVLTGIGIAAAFACWHRLLWTLHPGRETPFIVYIPDIGIFSILSVLALRYLGVSISDRLAKPFGVLRGLGTAYAIATLGYTFIAYSLRLPHRSREFLLGGITISYAATAIWQLAVMLLYREHRSSGRDVKHVIIVGNQFTLPQAISAIKENRHFGLRIECVLTLGEPADARIVPAEVRQEALQNISAVLDTTVVDYAIFTVYRQNPEMIERAILACQERGIEIWLKMDFIHKNVAFSGVDYLDEFPVLVFSLVHHPSMALLFKRGLDVVGSLILLLLSALPIVVCAVLIRLTSRGPTFFKQRRVGLNGREFDCYKLRSMYADAQKQALKYALKNEMSGPVFKMANDPRITPVGRILRKYSLDELPQFWNVLKGEMSLVGPRPPLPQEVGQYRGWQRRRLSMRPGITGLWQIMGRNRISNFDDWASLDLKYIDEWSLLLDFQILLWTFPVVVRGTGV